ncbi:MAG: hypothetical protein D6736_19730 [Nitrospinota bacterium]|nr:MAG: hypothetical protein D6736_19730 [Nitrospinota bacterium]
MAKRILTSLSFLTFLTLLTVSLFLVGAEPVKAGVAGKVYDVWVSQSFTSPPHDPFFDCARFGRNTMSLDKCGDSGPLTEIPINALLSLWIGRVPCGGLNLVFIGTAIERANLPSGANVIGASGLGQTEGTNFGLEGVENPDCRLPTAPEEEGSPYSAE